MRFCVILKENGESHEVKECSWEELLLFVPDFFIFTWNLQTSVVYKFNIQLAAKVHMNYMKKVEVMVNPIELDPKMKFLGVLQWGLRGSSTGNLSQELFVLGVRIDILS